MRGSPEFLRVLVSETDHELLCDATIRDEHLGGLLAYLNAGRTGVAGELLKLARGALFDKYNNPLGAAAGGYVLLSTVDSDQLGDWPHWLENLAENFPHLADGAILRVKWLLDRGGSADLPEARRRLREAYDRGVPFFTAGVAWLMEGLARVADGEDEFSMMLRTVRAVAPSVDLARGLLHADFDHLGGVVPLIDRRGNVQPLVALQADELAAERFGQHLGDLGLADTGLALEEQRALHAQAQEQHGGKRPVGDIAGV
jgi:hypothetical protein